MARARRRRPARRRARLLDLAHAQPPRRRRQAHPDLARRGGGADRRSPTAMREAGAGWLQIVSDFEDQDGEIGLFRRLAKESGRPVTITPAAVRCPARTAGASCWRRSTRPTTRGCAITAQVRSRPTSVLLGLELSQNPFMGRPSYKAIAHLPFAGAAGRSCASPSSRAHPGEAFEGSRRANAGRALGSHVPARRSAGLRAEAREQHRRPRGARRPDAGGGGLRPAARSATARACCTCRSPTTPPAISTWCAR